MRVTAKINDFERLLPTERLCHPAAEGVSVAPSEEAQPKLGPWTGFEPVRLETSRTPKHA
ncbi:hypothetical protein E2C01_018424 [Portunus trituberculatus]|uniref:Uncharacterized protein n=1 Tax=Portunus trituberculatus TaxID=210409 RepID=A0A5B7DV45_PORTR|nr:hypothetical protein [Portunus trituberculatus]